MVQRVMMFILSQRNGAPDLSSYLVFTCCFSRARLHRRELCMIRKLFLFFGALAVNSPGILGYAQTQQRQNPDIGLDHKSVYRTP